MEKFWETLGNLGEIFRIFRRFCHNIRAFMRRKIEPKRYISGEKMTNLRSDTAYLLFVQVDKQC